MVPRFPFLCGLLALGVFTLTRAGLATFTGFGSVPPSLWPGIFAKGLWFDLVVSAAAISPLLLYEALLPDRWRMSRGHTRLQAASLWVGMAILLFCAAAEATFWMEFSTRFNFIAVDYLLYTHEVIGNIRESYPTAWILSAIGAAAAAIVWACRPALRALHSAPISKGARISLALAAFSLPALGWTLVDIDQSRGSGNAYADELSGNGLLTLAAAMRRNELDYDSFYQTIPQSVADARLKTMDVERVPLSVVLRSGARNDGTADDVADDPYPFIKRPRNVVLISVESLSASFVGAYGSAKGLTPNLDRLARAGLKFERAFATGTRTVRGLEALSLGTPPVPGQAIVRRPDNENLATLGELFRRQGVAPLFLYGGYSYFDNMNAYFSGNAYEVLDRRSFPKESVPFENIWGVADEALFANALTALDRKFREGRPFFAHIMTTSNHRPYTYPDGRIDIPSPGGRDGAVKYTDYAIGRFVDEAKAKPWFGDTLFVVVADHCAAVAGKSRLPVRDYHIPLIFYAPGIVKASTYAPVVSQIDLPPTLIEVMGKRGDDHFFGRAFFEKGPNPARALISNYQELGYLRRDVLTVLSPKRRVESFRIDPKTYEATPAAVDAALREEAIAYYQTAARAFKRGALRTP